MERQHVANQKGEIEFRRKLRMQQIEGEVIFDDEFDKDATERILKERMDTTLARMTQIKDAGIPLSPYLEIGAERGQRSLIMENDIGGSGAAADISYDMLQSCEHYQKTFGKSKRPARLCCDANNLPFRSNSLPFVFCFEFLHHFPEPGPIVAEIFRVISPGGYFLFEEEPYKNALHWNLYKGKKAYSNHSLNRSKIRKLLDRLFATAVCNEVEHGVIENHEIPTAQWKDALNPFEKKDVWLRPFSRSAIESELFNPTSYLKYFAAYLIGGTISGLCKKQSGNSDKLTSISDALICPSCKQVGVEAPLNQNNSLFTCSKCSKQYPVIDGVAFLFEHEKFIELYPDVFQSFQKSLR